MLSRDFELYYYNDHNLSKVDLHSHNYYEFYFFMEGDVSIQIGTEVYPIHFGDIMLVPPHIPHRPIIHKMCIRDSLTAVPPFFISLTSCSQLLCLSGFILSFHFQDKYPNNLHFFHASIRFFSHFPRKSLFFTVFWCVFLQ